MAIINRFQIRRFKEVQVPVSAGLVEDGGFSTFTLDSPSINPTGTSDFAGVINKSVLLGEVIKEVLDTNPRRLRQDPLPIARFQQLTQVEFENLLQNGEIVLNPNTRGVAEVIGWVELGKSSPSFYYQTCENGKQPRSDNYYDLTDLFISTYRVSGQGTGIVALEQLGPWRYDETYFNWGQSAYPEQAPLSFEEYMKVVTNGGTFGKDTFTFLTERSLYSIPLLISNREENFNSNGSFTLTPSFADPTSQTITNEKNVFGRLRRTITEGFKSQFRTDLGICIPSTQTPSDDSEDTETEEDVLPNTYDYIDDGSSSDVFSDPDEEVVIVITNEDTDNSLELCEREVGLPIRIYSDGVYIGTGSNYYYGDPKNLPSGSQLRPETTETDVGPSDLILESSMESEGVRDPRSVGGNSLFNPHGSVKALLNKNDCVIEIHEDYRDKDGDHPEIVGPVVFNYIEKIRYNMIEKFRTTTPLKMIGYGTDGYDYYSDGNSFTELHGETILGCGKSFSIADIPEIFNEMYPNAIRNSGNNLIFGKDENENVTFYRRTFERPTQLPLEALKVLDWLGGLPTHFIEKRQTLSDMFNDFVLGIPDLDFSLVGDDENEIEFNDILLSALGAAAGGTVAYLFASDTDEYLNLALAGAVAGYSISEVLKKEENVYKKVWTSNSSKPRPRSISRYRSFNSFWKRDGLHKVYYETSLDSVQKRNLNNSDKKDITFVTPEGETITIERDNSNAPNTSVSKEDVSNSVVWEGKTLKQLRQAQYKLSYPSRWKSMMRPIYEQLWHNPEQIQPSRVATREYLGETIYELELGDYDTLRQQNGMSKNLYDYIDDTISFKINDGVFQDPESIDIFTNIVTDINAHLKGFFDEKFANLIGFNIQQPIISISTLIENVNNLSDFKSYLNLTESVLETYRDLVGTAAGIEEALNKIVSLAKDIITYFKEYDDGLIGPNVKDVQEIVNVKNNINAELTNLGKELVIGIAETVVNYFIQSGLQWLSNELNRSNPPRSSFSPRRIFREGTVYLQSKSGKYITNKQPCPVIFLGFNDDAVMSSFTQFNEQLDCLSTLQKYDTINTLKYLNKSGFLADGRSIMSFVQPNLGNIVRNIPQSNQNVTSTMLNPVREHYIPVMNKRIRQYGRNPLLDIFYLNLIPESFANNPSNIQSSRKSTYTHRTSTPMPYRYPNFNDWAGKRQITKDYSVPSHFPPHWNEPMITEGSPGQFYKDQSMFKHGDFLFFNRQSSNILSAKERWAMYLQPITSDDNILILKDKTPILDIYFGLLHMHIYGHSWAEINKFIERTKSAITISNVSVDFMGQSNIPSNLLSDIDVQELENISNLIDARLNSEMPLYISPDGFWNNVEPIVTSPTSTRFGEALTSVFLNQPESVNTYRRTLHLVNNTNMVFKIKSFSITPESDSLDMFGTSAEKMFYVGGIFKTDTTTEGIFDNTGYDSSDITVPLENKPITLQPFEPNSKNLIRQFGNFYSCEHFLNIWFIPYGAQPGFTYTANLEFTVEADGEEYVFNQKLVAKVANKTGVMNWDNNLLELPSTIYYGNINDITFYEQDAYGVDYKNFSRENILVEKMEIQNERMFDIDENNLTTDLKSIPSFFIFKDKINEERKSLTVNETVIWSGKDVIEDIVNSSVQIVIDKESLFLTNTFVENRVYTAELLVTYSLPPRINSTERVKYSRIVNLRFSTVK